MAREMDDFASDAISQALERLADVLADLECNWKYSREDLQKSAYKALEAICCGTSN